MKHITLKNFKKQFGTESACRKELLEYRKPESGKCINPKCLGTIEKYYKPLSKRKAFNCSRCLHHFYPMVDTIFDHSHVELNDWFEIIFLNLSNRNGMSANEIHRNYGYSYPTALRMQHAIRQLMGDCLDFDLQNTVVEVDESYVKTGTKGLNRHYKFGTGRGSERHTSILTITERHGVAKLFVIDATDAENILPIILEHIPKSTIIYTDSFPVYRKLSSNEYGYRHAMVNHDLEFVNDSASTNSAENVFSNFKRIITGTYRNVSENKLQLYLWESAFKHSYRNEADYGFENLLKAMPSLADSYQRKYQKSA
jgi:transposase-like protein